MPDVIRTPDERFANLPDWDHEPTYFTTRIDGVDLRLARHELGDPDGDPIVLMHGEPTWSYLYRKVVPPLVDAGHRVILPDLVGMGRSDKVTDVGWYDWSHLMAAYDAHLQDLGMRPFTLVVHDWGGILGLPWAVAHQNMVSRLVILDTACFVPGREPAEAWYMFRNFVERTDELPIGFLVDGACVTDLTDAEKAAYEAPFHTVEAQAGAKAFPQVQPIREEFPGAWESHEANLALSDWQQPTLILWGGDDVILPSKIGKHWSERIPGIRGFEVLENAHHFLQEDRGADIGDRIAAFMADNPV
ncbi:MAG: haloalkane dehalogenase [Nitriliruptorales bacterium]|nr:haloalkane dehalogenase [Nitriliruptorales bacterium]